MTVRNPGVTDDPSIRHGRRVVGIIGVLVGIVLIWLSVQLSFGSLAQPGAALAPTLIGVMMVVVCAATIVQSFRSEPFFEKVYDSEKISANDDAVTPVAPKKRFEPRIVAVVVMLITYAIAMPLVGFLPTSIILLISYGWLMARKDASCVTLVIYSLAAAIGIYAAFVKGFGVELP